MKGWFWYFSRDQGKRVQHVDPTSSNLLDKKCWIPLQTMLDQWPMFRKNVGWKFKSVQTFIQHFLSFFTCWMMLDAFSRASIMLYQHFRMKETICKIRNGESGNRMRRIRVWTRGIRVGTWGITVGTRGIKVGMWGIGVGILGMRGMWGIRVGMQGNQGDSLWESSCSLLWLKSRSARGAFHHPAFMGTCPTISHTYLALPTKWITSPSKKWERFYVSLVPMLGF